MKEERDEEADEIREIHGEICLQAKDEMLHDIIVKKWTLIKNGVSHKVFTELVDFDVSCKERVGEEIVNGSIM